MGTMRTRRWRSPAAVALAAFLGLPALAEAQLFPDMNIKRERPPRSHEAPIYSLYRQQYYGYFPTCWRRFPPGWGCPSPEAPDFAKSLRPPPEGVGPLPTRPEPLERRPGDEDLFGPGRG